MILDYAHGKDVPGKQSPDGKHHEYLWSRQVGKQLKQLLEVVGYVVYESCTSENECGLTHRANTCNLIEEDFKFFISLHNNAAANEGWQQARGFEVWTSVGQTKSDEYATEIFNSLKHEFPEFKARQDVSDGDPDKESNFTVLEKTKCPAVLIEWLFQDNQLDVAILADPVSNMAFCHAVKLALDKIETTLL